MTRNNQQFSQFTTRFNRYATVRRATMDRLHDLPGREMADVSLDLAHQFFGAALTALANMNFDIAKDLLTQAEHHNEHAEAESKMLATDKSGGDNVTKMKGCAPLSGKGGAGSETRPSHKRSR